VESKRDKFIRIAESRTNKIIHMVRLLGNCSNTNVYEFSEEDVKKIFSAIENELRNAKERYGNTELKVDRFTLD
jgi:hypothetical protein